MTIAGTGGELEILTGDGSDTVNLRAVGAAAFVDTGAGNDTVRVSSAASDAQGVLTGIAAPLNIVGSGDNDTLTVDANGDTVGLAGTLSFSQLTGLGMAAALDYSRIENLQLTLGTGADQLTVRGTHGQTTRIAAGGGADTIDVQAVNGPTTIDAGAGPDTVHVTLAVDTEAETPNSIAGLLTVAGGTGPDLDSLDVTVDSPVEVAGTLTARSLRGFRMSDGIDYSGWESLHIALGAGTPYRSELTIESTHAGTTEVQGGQIVAAGTDDDDHLELDGTGQEAGSYVMWTGAGPAALQRVSFLELNELTFNGSAGDDVMTIRHPDDGFLNLAGGIAFHGGTQDNDGNALTGSFANLRGHTLRILGPANIAADTVTHRLDLPGADGHAGLITIEDTTLGDARSKISYTGLEPVLDYMPAVNRLFEFKAGAETVVLTTPGDGGLANQIGSELSETVSFGNPTGSLTVDVTVGSGANAIRIEGVGVGFNADLTIVAGNDDPLTFQTHDTHIGSGDLTATAASIAFLANFTTGGNAVLTALNGSVTDNADDGVANVTANHVTIDVQATGHTIGISQGNRLEINAATLAATTVGRAGDDMYLTDTAGGVGLEHLNAGAADLFFAALGGPLTDANGDGRNLTARRAELLAAGGVGSGNGLETALEQVAGSNAGSGNIELANTGPLAIVTVGGTAGVTSPASIVISATGLLTIGNGGGQDIVAPAGTVDVTAPGVSELAGSVISAANLRLRGTGVFNLSEANLVGTLAAKILGSLLLRDADDIKIGTVWGTAGIATGNGADGGPVTIETPAGTITVDDPVTTLPGTGGGILLSGSVAVNAPLTAAGGTITLRGRLGANDDLLVNGPLTASACGTVIREFTVTPGGDGTPGKLDIRFWDRGGQDGNFVVSGIEIWTGSETPPDLAPLLAGPWDAAVEWAAGAERGSAAVRNSPVFTDLKVASGPPEGGTTSGVNRDAIAGPPEGGTASGVNRDAIAGPPEGGTTNFVKLAAGLLATVVAEAVAWWTALGLTPAQSSALSEAQFAVADLGGSYLGLADVPVCRVLIDDDAAGWGWSGVGDRSSMISHRWPVASERSPITGYRSPVWTCSRW